MQQNRQKEKNGTEASGLPRASTGMKGVEAIERSQKKLEDRVSKLATDVNKKLSTIMSMMEQNMNNNLQGNFSSIQRSFSPDETAASRPRRDSLLSQNSAIREDDAPTEPTSSRSRLNSKDSISSLEIGKVQRDSNASQIGAPSPSDEQNRDNSSPDSVEEDTKQAPLISIPKDVARRPSNSGLNGILKKAIQLGRDSNPSTNGTNATESSSTKKRHSFSEPVITSVQEIPPPHLDSPIDEVDDRKVVDHHEEVELDIIEDNGDKSIPLDMEEEVSQLKVTLKPISPRLNASNRKIATTITNANNVHSPVANNFYQQDTNRTELMDPNGNIVIPGPRISFLNRPVSPDRMMKIRALREGQQ